MLRPYNAVGMCFTYLSYTTLGGEYGFQPAAAEGFQGHQAGGKFGGIELAAAVERAQEIGRRPSALLRIAVSVAGNQVAVGIDVPPAAVVPGPLGSRKDVVERSGAAGQLTAAVEAATAFTAVDGIAQPRLLKKIGGFEIKAGTFGLLLTLRNFRWEPQRKDVPVLAAREDAHGSFLRQAAHCVAHGTV